MCINVNVSLKSNERVSKDNISWTAITDAEVIASVCGNNLLRKLTLITHAYPR